MVQCIFIDTEKSSEHATEWKQNGLQTTLLGKNIKWLIIPNIDKYVGKTYLHILLVKGIKW